jgi:hypothetical protein
MILNIVFKLAQYICGTIRIDYVDNNVVPTICAMAIAWRVFNRKPYHNKLKIQKKVSAVHEPER